MEGLTTFRQRRHQIVLAAYARAARAEPIEVTLVFAQQRFRLRIVRAQEQKERLPLHEAAAIENLESVKDLWVSIPVVSVTFDVVDRVPGASCYLPCSA